MKERPVSNDVVIILTGRLYGLSEAFYPAIQAEPVVRQDVPGVVYLLLLLL